MVLNVLEGWLYFGCLQINLKVKRSNKAVRWLVTRATGSGQSLSSFTSPYMIIRREREGGKRGGMREKERGRGRRGKTGKKERGEKGEKTETSLSGRERVVWDTHIHFLCVCV